MASVPPDPESDLDPGLAPDELDPFGTEFDPATLSGEALATAERIRGKAFPPMVMLHAACPRSGTNWVGDILRQHPEVFDYPNRLFEFPLLRSTPDLLRQRAHFFGRHRSNRGRMAPNDFLVLFGSAVVAHLQSFSPPGRTLLLKEPWAEHLRYLPALFPFERCLLLLRDGRDVVTSERATFDRVSFEEASRRWADGTRAMLAFARRNPTRARLVRYEEVFADPGAFAAEACAFLDLDPALYPFEAIPGLPLRGSCEFSSGEARDPVARPRPEGFAPIGRWHAWSRAERDDFERVAGDALREAGYGE